MKKPALTDFLPTCERCRHWREEKEAEAEKRVGECWRYPPVVLMGIDGELCTTRAASEFDMTCGEFGAAQ